MTEDRKARLLEIAQKQAQDILDDWFLNIYSWDDLFEKGAIEYEEYEYLMGNTNLTAIVEWKDD